MKRLFHCFLLIFLLSCQHVWATDSHGLGPTELTGEERAWIELHPVIRVSNELAWPPINFVENGVPSGFSVEYIKLVAQKVGIQLEFIQGNWSDLLQMSFDKKLDLMLNIVLNKQREEKLLFTRPYASTPTAIFVKIEDRHLTSLDALTGKRVAVVKDFYTHRYLKEHRPDIELVPTLTTLESVTAVSTGQADAMLDRLAVGNYVIATNFITNVTLSGVSGIAVLDKSEWRLGIRNDWPELFSILKKGMEMVPAGEYTSLLNKWYLHGNAKSLSGMKLTREERAWLKRHPSLRVGVDPEYAPYEYIDKQGRHQGIAADYMQLLSERLGIDLEVATGLSWKQVMQQAKEKRLDIVAAVTKTPERSRFLDFSQPYIQYQIAVVTRKDHPAVAGIDDFIGKEVALIRNYAYTELVLKQQPGIKPLYVDTVLDGLKAVAGGQARAIISDLGSMSHNIQKYNLANLSVATLTHLQTKGLTVGVRDDYPILVPIINKALDSIPEEERLQIRQRWTPLGEKKKALDLSHEEQQWLARHPVIRMAPDPDFSPLEFFNDQGVYQGLVADHMHLIEKQLGVKFEVVRTKNWSEALEAIKTGKADFMGANVADDKFRKSFIFTSPYFSFPDVIITNSNIKGSLRLEDLKGKEVVSVKDWPETHLLKLKYPQIRVVEASSTIEGLRKVAFGEYDYMLSYLPTASYIIEKHSFPGLRMAGFLPDMVEGSIMVSKELPILRDILQKALNSITWEEQRALLKKWISSVSGSLAIHFTSKEKAWLAAHRQIRIGTMDAWPPFDFVDNNGIPAGIGSGYIKALNQRLDGILEIVPGSWKKIYDDVKEKQLDVIMDITPKKEREAHFNFTSPYMDVPHVIVAPKDTAFILNEEDLKGKTLALERGFGNVKYFKENYPLVKIREYRDTSHALGAVSRGEAEAYAGNRAVALYLIGKEVITNLQIHGRLKKSGSILAVGTRKDWPILRDILQKALDNISPEEKRAIISQWVAPEKKQPAVSLITLSPEEKLWLKAHPTITVSSEVDCSNSR